MATADEVIVEFEARVGAYERDLKRAQHTFEQTTKAQESRLAAFERRMAGGFGRIIGAAATVAAAREMLRLVDAGKQIEAQLRLATRETGSFVQAQEDVRRIAMATRAGLDDTARLYSVFTRDMAALGITQDEAARATETLTKAFVVSGATAEETSNATRQLIQGLQSGTLRGDEFNSVMEQAPRLQKLFAAALGVSKGELRGMAEEGKITAAALVDALTNTKFTEGLDAEFREMPVTFGQAMQQVENAAIITFSAFDRGGGFSQMLANFVTDGANGFADLERAAVDTGIEVRSTFAGLADAFQPLLDGARAVFGEIGSEAKSLSEQVSNTLGEIDAISEWLSGPEGSLERALNERIGFGPSDLQGRFDRGQQASERDRRALLEGQAEMDRRQALAAGSRAAPARAGGAADKPARRRGPSAETLAARAERDRVAAIREEGDKQQGALRALDDIIAARAALATAAEDMARFELQQLGVEQAARLSQLNTDRRIGDLTQQEYAAREQALAEEMDLRRQAINFQREQLVFEAEREKQREGLRQQADQAALESDTLRARADIADTLDQRRFLEASALAIQQEIERSLLEQAIAEGRIADAAAARAALGDRQQAETRGLERQNQGPLGRYVDSMSDPKTRVEEAVVRKLEAVNEGISDAITDALGTDDPVIKDLFSIFLDQVIFRPLAQAMQDASGGGGFGGLLGSAISAVSSILGAPRGIGGPARAGVPIEVGEFGKEVFVPQQNGVIVPNHRLQGRGAGTTVISSPQFDLRGAVVTADLYADMERISRANAAEAGALAYGKAMKDAPTAIQRAQRYGR